MHQSPTGPAQAGSRLQLQCYVNEAPALLNTILVQTIPDLPDNPQINWVSPLARANYAEYRDEAFLAALQLHHLAPQLVGNFWPRGGPCWDALAIVRSATDPTGHGILLVEAKSHLQEVYGTGCQAGPHSLPRILEALTETAAAAGTVVTPAWTGRLYQTANRLAHLHFFRERARMPAWLVDVSFVHDPYKPTTRGQWETFLPTVWGELGIRPGPDLRTPTRPAFMGRFGSIRIVRFPRRGPQRK